VGKEKEKKGQKKGQGFLFKTSSSFPDELNRDERREGTGQPRSRTKNGSDPAMTTNCQKPFTGEAIRSH